MKKSLFTLVLALWAGAAAAQEIQIGERTPEIRVASWYDQKPPAAAEITLTVFVLTEAKGFDESLRHLTELSRRTGDGLSIVILTRESPRSAGPLLAPYLTDRIAAGFDDQGRTFADYRIRFVPFSVLTDAKGRALWLGNPMKLTPDILRDNL